MGGDFAPSQIIEGARRAVDELGLDVILVGVPDLLGDPLGLDVFACSEIIAMDDDPDASDELSYPIEHGFVDLAPLVHDAILLDLPLAPLCRADCAGLCPYCGIDRNDESCDCQSPLDPRWATLDELRFIDFQADESKEV